MRAEISSVLNGEQIPVLLLKTKSSPHDGYEEYFSSTARNYHYKPIFVPVLKHKFNHDNLGKVRDLFVSRDLRRKYGGLVFTSQRAVEGFSRMITEEVDQSLAIEASLNLALYTVGPATFRSLNTLRKTHLPHAALIGEKAGTGEALAKLILDHYNDLERNKPHFSINNENRNDGGKLPLLFLVGETHRDIIPKTLMSPELPASERIHIDELIVYETGVMDSFRQNFAFILDELNIASTQDGDESHSSQVPIWVVVFSPTGCDAMLDILGVSIQDSCEGHGVSSQKDIKGSYKRRWCRIATIGPTTREHLRLTFGVEPDVCAEKPSPEGVGNGIEAAISASS
ncbi:uroporphyrinogen-III synthase [Ophidiomyces ophidiicola]|nr:uroporphyrinogen-III synthase [Ophidiomyces ophidiicola]